jgi:poly(rC)-binding protein 2/3/4
MISRQMEGKKDGMVTIRLLVPTKKINCLIGKGRSINEDILRATQADIRLLSKENFPSCASIEEDELVEVFLYLFFFVVFMMKLCTLMKIK